MLDQEKFLAENNFIVSFEHLNKNSLLDEWKWLIGDNKYPILLTSTGNAFIYDSDDESVWFLDIAEDDLVLTKFSESIERFRELIEKQEILHDYFMVGFVEELIKSNKKLSIGQIYSFKTLPILGGEYKIDNMEISDIEVHFSVSGQIFRQIRDLPEGTSINKVDIIK